MNQQLCRLLLIYAGLFGDCRPASAACDIDIKLFDSQGLEIPGHIRKVMTSLERTERESRRPNVEAVPMITGQRISFGDPLTPGQRITLSIVGPKGLSYDPSFSFAECGQRQSIVLGRLEMGGGEGHSEVSGRLVGCAEYKDSWVRLMPMFGMNEQALNPEVVIDRKSGRFRVSAFLPGVRHVAVVGRGNSVIVAFGVNLIEGGQVTLGDISIRAKCK